MTTLLDTEISLAAHPTSIVFASLGESFSFHIKGNHLSLPMRKGGSIVTEIYFDGY